VHATLPAAAFQPATVLCDTRPARGKHRAPAELPRIVLAWSRRSRGAFHLTGATAGAVLAATVLS
jgi:hypothetical protein